MADKFYVNTRVKLIIRTDPNVNIYNILNEMDYSFKDTTGKADIIDTEITDYEIEDSK